MKFKKRYFALYLLFCLFFGVVIYHLNWAEPLARYVVPIGFAIVIGSALINLGYNAYYARKVNALLPLQLEKRYIDYLAEIEPIRARVKSKHIRYFCVLSMATSYDNMGEFEQALALLHTIPTQHLLKEHRHLYHLNLATCYFHNKQNSEGLAHYEAHKDEILGLTAYPLYQPYVEVLKLYVLLEKGAVTEAREQLEFIQDCFDFEVIAEEFDLFAAKLGKTNMRDQLLYEEDSDDKTCKFEIYPYGDGFDVYLLDFDVARDGYYDRLDVRHLVDTFEDAKKLGKQLLSQERSDL